MATGFVDLGYYSPHYIQLNGDTIDATSEDNYFLDLRARIVAAGKMDDTNFWGVSDVGKWNGTSANYHGYGIRIEHRDGAGTPTGRVWMLIWGGRHNNVDQMSGPTNVLQNSTQVDAFYDDIDGSSSSSQGFFAVHMVDASTGSGGVDDYDWGVASPLGAPTTNPHTNMVGFMPNNALKGFRGSALGGSTYRHRLVLVFDHDNEFIMCLQNRDDRADFQFGFLGAGTVNSDSGDTNTSLGFGGTIAVGTSPAFNLLYCQAFDAASAAQTYSIDVPGFISITNEITGGKARTEPISLYNALHVKGTINKDIFPVAFAATGGYGRLVNRTYGVAFNAVDFCLPWASGVAIPFAGWPTDPQDIPS